LIKVHAILRQHWRLLKTSSKAAGNQSLSVADQVQQGTPIPSQDFALSKVSSGSFLKDPTSPAQESIQASSLETLLWQYAMSSSLKSPPEGLQNAKCKKGTPPFSLPIPYVPPTDLHEKRETEQIKVELPDGTKVPDAHQRL
jgi:hypothetical protein